jgi:hypothetical protein
MDSCLLVAITSHLLNMIINQVMLIDRSRLATYASHAIFSDELYEITFCHDYNIVNVILVYTMQTITKIRINSQPCKGNNLTT